MSRTDKTNPYRVKVHEKHEFLEEVHDHRDKICDLPDRPKTGSKDIKFRNDGSCFWHVSFAFWRDPMGCCNCPRCGYDAYETPRKKRERQERNAYCRNEGWRDEY